MAAPSLNALDVFPRCVAEFDRRVTEIADEQWDAPTPCTEWNVRQLVNHLVYEDRWAVPLLEGKTLDEVGDRFEGRDLLGDNPKATWTDAKEATLRSAGAVSSPDQSVHVSWGQIGADEYLGQLGLDHLIHAWDLARAIGADEVLDPELVAMFVELVEAQEAQLRASGAYGQRLSEPEGADAQTHLLALVGRAS